ncbi:MAG: helicase HerA-like domain-containing protein [Sandaracinaceae bacterium]
MTLYAYNVSQVRLAAMCPRIHYFDAEYTRRKGLQRRRQTRLWKKGDGAPAGGALFHRVVEKMARLARQAPEIREIFEKAQRPEDIHQGLGRFVHARCLDTRALAERRVEYQQGFVRALQTYLAELSELTFYGLTQSRGITPDVAAEHLFGDPRKRVDVSLRVLDDDAVRITGSLDHLYYDWRLGAYRVLEYKLTPRSPLHGDLVQASAYALLHNHQHGTRPAVAVFYLLPQQHEILEKTWEEVYAERGKVYNYIGSMVAWERFDERSGEGLRPFGVPTVCSTCPWDKQCVRRLGPKDHGDLLSTWEDLTSGDRAEPTVEAAANPSVEAEGDTDADDLAADPAEEDEGPGEDRDRDGVQRRQLRPDGPTLRIGRTVGNDEVAVPVTALNTHVAVVGSAGSGKTWTAKVLAEEAIRNGVPVLALDPQGDLVQFLRQRSIAEVPEELRPLYREYSERVEPRVFTPGTSHGTRLSLDPIRLPERASLEGRFSDAARQEEEERAMVHAVAGNLVRLASIGGDAAAQVTFLYQLLLNFVPVGRPSLSSIVEAIHHPEAAGVDNPDIMIKKTEREKLGRSLMTYVLGPAASLFHGGSSLDLDRLVRASSPGKTPLNVVYLNALTSDEQKHFFVASLATEIYRWMVSGIEPTGQGTNLLFYIDEARDYIPAGSASPPAKEPLIRLFTQGRKYGVGCLLCTQSPRSVDYNVFGNCSSKLIGRLGAAQDVERVREWFTTGSPPTWIARRKGAAKGSFVGRWVEGGPADGTEMKSRLLFSVHEGAWSPDRVETEVRRAAPETSTDR